MGLTGSLFAGFNSLSKNLGRNPGSAPYKGLYGDALPERGAISRQNVCKRVVIFQVEVYEKGIAGFQSHAIQNRSN